MNELTKLLQRAARGDDRTEMDALLKLVDSELRALAASHLKKEHSAVSLQVSDLVNEAYLRLAGEVTAQDWQNRSHFFGAASEAMRRILVDHARKKKSLKRGGTAERLELSPAFLAVEDRTDEILDVNDALDELERHDKRAAELVKLRYFIGMKHREAAEVMGIQKRVADRLWLVAKTWLFKALKDDKR